jgi:hypothetical protein
LLGVLSASVVSLRIVVAAAAVVLASGCFSSCRPGDRLTTGRHQAGFTQARASSRHSKSSEILDQHQVAAGFV